MQAFYQGKIDNFCAMYAVLNAVQVLFGLAPLHARKIFNRAMMEQARDFYQQAGKEGHGEEDCCAVFKVMR